MNINIGSGFSQFENFLNCDIDKSTNPDFCFDLEKDVWPFDDNSVNQVIAHHILEHLGDGFFHCMKELYRVCANGAIIHIKVPHPRHDTFISDPSHKRPITPLGLSLFSKKYNDTNKNTCASRLGYFYNVNFELVEYHEIPDQQYINTFDNFTIEDAKRYINEHNNIVSEYLIKLIVIKND